MDPTAMNAKQVISLATSNGSRAIARDRSRCRKSRIEGRDTTKKSLYFEILFMDPIVSP